MYLFCVHEPHLSGDVAYLRIRAARAARRFPAIFEFVADGRLHPTAVVMRAPRLTPEDAAELLAAANYKTKWEIKELLAQRFPQPELPALVEALPAAAPLAHGQLGPDRAGVHTPELDCALARELGLDPVGAQVPARVGTSGRELGLDPVAAPVPRPKPTPVAPERFAVQLAIGKDMHEKLRHAQALPSHRIPSGDLAAVLDLALDALIGRLEKRKFGKIAKPRPRRSRGRADPRHIRRT